MSMPGTKSMINGVVTDYLNINDRAIHYGDGLFETVLCSNRQLYYWPQHYQRLSASCEKIKIGRPDEWLLLDDIKNLLLNNADSAVKNFAIKIIVTRGAGKRGYQADPSARPNRLVLLSEIDGGYSSILSGRLLSGSLYLCEQQVAINQGLAGMKHLNRLENVLARNEWQGEACEADIIDGLMRNANNFVIEGTMSNLFAVKNKQLFTPDLTQSGVKGVMRDEIINIAKHGGVKISVANLVVDELLDMDELFVTNSLIGMKSINRFVDREFTKNEITKSIFEKLLTGKNNHVQVV